jgi:transposase-like protein
MGNTSYGIGKEDTPMPWKETCVMDEKIKFIVAVKSETYSFAEVCRQFGISRKCGYELVRRYDAEGEKALVERSCGFRTMVTAISGRT